MRSANGASPKQRGTLESLKLGRIGKESTLADTPQLRGALDKVDLGHERLAAVDVNDAEPEPA